MEDLNSEAEIAPQPRRAGPALNIFNLLAGLFLVLSCLSGLCVAVVFAAPGVIPIDFRPPTEVAIVRIEPPTPIASNTPGPTPTETSIIATLPPEWTDTPTPTETDTPPASATPRATETPGPTNTLGPTGTPIPTLTLPPTATSTRTATPTGPTPTASVTRSPFSYTMQNGNPTYISNFANTAGCSWQGIAGTALNLQGQHQIGLIVHLEGGGLNVDAVTGAKTAYGASGYEHFLTDSPKDTSDVFRIQLRTTAGTPLSDVYIIPTFANPTSGGCPRNLALVNFVQNH